MKQKNSELVARIFLAVVAVILIGIIVYYIKIFVDNTTGTTNEVLKNTQEISEEYSDYKISMYDGEDVRGSQVVNFIKKNLGDYSSTETAPIYINVTTVYTGTTYLNQYINKLHITDIKNFSSTKYYIKPTAWFSCEVIKSDNKVILGISFQQK